MALNPHGALCWLEKSVWYTFQRKCIIAKGKEKHLQEEQEKNLFIMYMNKQLHVCWDYGLSLRNLALNTDWQNLGENDKEKKNIHI